MPGSTARMARKTLETLTAIISSQAAGSPSLDVARDVDAGVGEQDVDAAEAVVDGGDHALDLGGDGEIGRDDEGVAGADAGADGLEALGGAGGEREAGALAAEHRAPARGRCRSWRR